MMCWSRCRRATHEWNFGNSEGSSLGERGFPSGCGTGRNGRLFLYASTGVGGKHAFAGASEANAACEATHGVAEPNERAEPAGGRDLAATSCRRENDSRSNGSVKKGATNSGRFLRRNKSQSLRNS